MPEPYPRVKRPWTLAAAALVVAGQGVLMIILGVVEVVRTSPGNLGVSVTSGAFFVLIGAGLLAAARGLAGIRSWARSPVVAAELIELLIAYSFTGGDTTLLAVLLAVIAAVVLVCVFHPLSTSALAADGAG